MGKGSARMNGQEKASPDLAQGRAGAAVPSGGTVAQRARLYAGLVLFAFILSHFLNHALGNVSLAVMQAGQDLRYEVWSSRPGQILLYGALAVHVVLALIKLARRRTWRMPVWEAAQILLGLSITCLLIKHIVATRLAMDVFHTNVDYRHELTALWDNSVFWQSALLVIVWGHAIIGLHYWLRLRRWYRALRGWLAAAALLVPTLALTGWINAARLLAETGRLGLNNTASERAVLADWMHQGRWGLVVVLGAIALVILARRVADRFGKGFTITYPDGRQVRSRPGPTLLEISRANGLPHLSVCGGRARCSTCRTRILAGGDRLASPSTAERTVLARIRAGNDIRLACQIRPQSDLEIEPMLAGRRDFGKRLQPTDDLYRWGVERAVSVMFVDLRGFTALSEGRLPYDVVFILNRYLDGAGEAIRKAGGLVDKVMGDGIMALFGIDKDARQGARDALQAVLSLAQALERANADLAAQLDTPLRLGIGLHTGPAILGRIGLAGAAGAAAQLTALGDTVNVASRLEGASKDLGGFAVISNSTLEAAGIEGLALAGIGGDSVPATPHAVGLRGRTEPLEVWAVRDPVVLVAALQASEVGGAIGEEVASV